MAQFNINMTKDFERDLARFMRLRRVKTKSDAIRLAIREGVERLLGAGQEADFREWIGLAEGRLPGRKERFKDDDELWSK